MTIDEVEDRVRRSGVLPVITLSDPAHAVPVGQALWKGGVDVIEITFRAPGAAKAIADIRRALPDMMVGAGTVIRQDDVAQAARVGAHFALAPGTNEVVLDAAAAAGLPFIPGAFTPTDIEFCLAREMRLIKLFPAVTLGGPTGIKTLTTPYRHLDPAWLPTGGIDARLAAEYRAVEGVVAVGGSWLVPDSLVETGEWAAITARAHEAALPTDPS